MAVQMFEGSVRVLPCLGSEPHLRGRNQFGLPLTTATQRAPHPSRARLEEDKRKGLSWDERLG